MSEASWYLLSVVYFIIGMISGQIYDDRYHPDWDILIRRVIFWPVLLCSVIIKLLRKFLAIDHKE